MGARNPRQSESGQKPSREVTDRRLHAEREQTDRALDEALPAVEAKAEAKLRETRKDIDRTLEQQKARAPDAAPAVDAATRAIAKERRQTDREVRRAHDEAGALVDGVLREHRQETNQALSTERTESDERVDARDEFFATISHDLRNLINVINLKSRFLKHELTNAQSTARARQLADEIHRSTRMMMRWSKDLVDLASVEAGRLRIEFAAEDAVAIVFDAVEICATLADEKGVAISVDVPERPCSVECDADRIVEVVINLLENATRHTARGGTIAVVLRDEPDGVRVRVTDTGSGIPREQLAYVFERYFQGKSTRTGTGMGLYICRHIVERHGGHISVESTPDVGSTFWFTLPHKHVGSGSP